MAVEEFLGEILLAAALTILELIRRRSKIKADEIAISNIREIKTLKRALIIITKSIDKQTKKEHGESPEIACLTKDLLTDAVLNGSDKRTAI